MLLIWPPLAIIATYGHINSFMGNNILKVIFIFCQVSEMNPVDTERKKMGKKRRWRIL